MGFLWAWRLIALVGQTFSFSSAEIILSLFISLGCSLLYQPWLLWYSEFTESAWLTTSDKNKRQVIVDRHTKPLIMMCQIHWSLKLSYFPIDIFEIFLIKWVLEKVVEHSCHFQWCFQPLGEFNCSQTWIILGQKGHKERSFILPTVAAEFTVYCSAWFIYDTQWHKLLCLHSHLLVFHPCPVKTFC